MATIIDTEHERALFIATFARSTEIRYQYVEAGVLV